MRKAAQLCEYTNTHWTQQFKKMNYAMQHMYTCGGLIMIFSITNTIL